RDLFAFKGRDLGTIPRDDDDLTLLDYELLARVMEDGGDVRRHEYLIVSKADDKRRRAIAGEDDVLGIVGRKNAQGIRAFDDGQRAADGADQVTVAKFLLEKMGEHLGVRFAGEG